MKNFEDLVNKYRKKGILLDSNLLLLFFVGQYKKSYIPQFKRTQKFVIEDFDTLNNFIRHFEKIFTTPNILTEVSNFAGQMPDNYQFEYFQIFAQGISQILTENYLRSNDLTPMREFEKFGLTDAGIKKIGEQGILILTEDFKLSQYLQGKNIDAINFNNIRMYNWE